MFPMAKKPFKSVEDEEEEENETDDENYDDDGEEEEEEEEGEGEVEEAVNEDKRKKIMIRVVYGQGSRTSSGSCCSWSCCQADECGVDLRMAKKYHQRHKVCERHSKAPVVLVSGIRQRFCQQCSKFHELAQFDDTKRSCRQRLAGHNERRRKSHADLHPGSEQQP